MPKTQKKRQSKDSVHAYLTEIGRVDRLTHEEEVSLGNCVQASVALRQAKEELEANRDRPVRTVEWAKAVGLSTAELKRRLAAGEQAQRRMVAANLRLVVSIAKKYVRHKHNLDLMDLVQEGTLGLQRGVEKFDPGKGCRFSTYAYWWIRQAVTRAIAEKSRTIRVPIHIVEKLDKIRRTQRTLIQELGREPSLEEVAAELDMPLKKVQYCLTRSRQPISLNLLIGDQQDAELGEVIEAGPEHSPENHVQRSTLKQDLQQILNHLTPKQKEVLILRFGLDSGEGLSLAKIGERLAVSRERVRQIEQEALRKLRTSHRDLRAYLAS